MGERLVVQIKRNNKPIATSYYHWSAYTLPALAILESMYKYTLCDADRLTDDELKLALIRFAENTTPYGYVGTKEAREQTQKEYEKIVEATSQLICDMFGTPMSRHGGVDDQDFGLVNKIFPNELFKEDGINRNDGLVAISSQAMENQLSWAQATVVVDMDTKMVSNGTVYVYNTQEYLEEIEDDAYASPPDQIPQIPIDLGKFRLEDIQDLHEIIKYSDGPWVRFEDKIYQTTEG